MLSTSVVLADGGSQKVTDEMKQKASENVPENIQRSTPSGQEFSGSGTGPGSRGDELAEMDEVEAKKNPTDPEKFLKEKDIAAESAKDKHPNGSKKGKE
jgi:hypothetical protein